MAKLTFTAKLNFSRAHFIRFGGKMRVTSNFHNLDENIIKMLKTDL